MAQHAHHLELLSVLEGQEGSPVLHGRVAVSVRRCVIGGDAVPGQEVQMLPALGQDALGAQLELPGGVLGEHERREGGQQPLRLRSAVQADRTHVHDVHTGLGREMLPLVAESGIHFGETVLIIVLALLVVGTGRKIVVQVQHARGEGETGTQTDVGGHLGRTVERIERSAGLQVVHVGHVGRHRMPGLAQREGDGAFVPAEFHESLAQAQDGDAAAEVVEVGLDLAGNAHGVPLVAGDVQAQTGREGDETPVEADVQVVAPAEVRILGHVEIKVFRAGADLTGIDHGVIADKAVQFELGRRFLRNGSASGQERRHCKEYHFLSHIRRTGRVS